MQKIKSKSIIIVIVLLFIISILYLMKNFSYKTNPSGRINHSTKQIISQIEFAASIYKGDYGHYPIVRNENISVEDLQIKSGKNMSIAEIKNFTHKINGKQYFIDEFGNQIIYKCPGEKNLLSFDIISKGEDGILGTEDDVTNFENP